MAQVAEQQTIGQWLESLAVSNISTDKDDTKMRNLLRRIGFPQAICICGVVYMEGHGTIDAPPTSIHGIAQALVKRVASK